MEYTLATMNDLPAIKALLARYHKDTISQEDIPGGFVTTKLSDQQFEDLIVNRKGVTLAKDENGTKGLCPGCGMGLLDAGPHHEADDRGAAGYAV